MAKTVKKSIAYYVLVGCILLIITSFFLAIIWQPSFEYGYISVSVLNGAFVFSLWLFLAACLSSLLFGTAVVKTIKSSYRKEPFAFAVAFGFASAIFYLLPSFHIVYVSGSSGSGNFDRAFTYYRIILAFALFLIVLLLLLLFYKRKSLMKNESKIP